MRTLILIASAAISATPRGDLEARFVMPCPGPQAENNTSALTNLGRVLFFDKRLSADGTLSCATCHDPATAFADHNTLALGVKGSVGTRNVPTILNSAAIKLLFLDGRATSLEEQARQPFVSDSEMDMPGFDAVVARLKAIPEYKNKFKQVFGGEGINIDTIVRALAAYERTLVSKNSPFDRFLTGDVRAITEAQKRGWDLFNGKARCALCHDPKPPFPLFADNAFHNTGIASRNHDLEELANRVQQKAKEGAVNEIDPDFLARARGYSELGRFNVTRESKDIGAFKTPTLRDVELTAPYMHNGSLKTLIDVVMFYNKGGEANAHLDPQMKPLGLTDPEMNDLVQFLRALTSDDVLKMAQTSTPQTRTPARPPR